LYHGNRIVGGDFSATFASDSGGVLRKMLEGREWKLVRIV
jgi:hypothetical protein